MTAERTEIDGDAVDRLCNQILPPIAAYLKAEPHAGIKCYDVLQAMVVCLAPMIVSSGAQSDEVRQWFDKALDLTIKDLRRTP